MRMEAKHQVFKKKKWRNFKNIVLSVLQYHQNWMCREMIATDGNYLPFYVHRVDSVKEGQPFTIPDDNLYIQKLSEKTGHTLDAIQNMTKTIKVTVCGIIYKAGMCLYFKNRKDIKLFGVLRYVAVLNFEKIFIIEPLSTKLYLCHYDAYVVEKNIGDIVRILLSMLWHPWPMIVYKESGG